MVELFMEYMDPLVEETTSDLEWKANKYREI